MGQCIPGCEDLEKIDETHYRGRLTNQVAHVKFNARFVAEISELDRPNRIQAILTGEDRRLSSSIKVTATLTIEPNDSGASVGYQMELALWGKLGRLGESIVRRRSLEVEREFISALTLACTNEPALSPISTKSAEQTASTAVSAQLPTTPSVPAPPTSAAKPRQQNWFAKLISFFRRSK